MFKQVTGLFALTALVASLVAVPATAAHAQNRNTNQLVVPITGTVDGVAGTLTGTFSISRFSEQAGELVAVGKLTATISDAAGNTIRTVIQQVAIPVASATGSCDILNLVLGPLHLDLLGLQVDLNQVVLDITAQAGAGNLVGNLLCAIAGLLDSGGLLTQLTGLLNQLLGALAGL